MVSDSAAVSLTPPVYTFHNSLILNLALKEHCHNVLVHRTMLKIIFKSGQNQK